MIATQEIIREELFCITCNFCDNSINFPCLGTSPLRTKQVLDALSLFPSCVFMSDTFPIESIGYYIYMYIAKRVHFLPIRKLTNG